MTDLSSDSSGNESDAIPQRSPKRLKKLIQSLPSQKHQKVTPPLSEDLNQSNDSSSLRKLREDFFPQIETVCRDLDNQRRDHQLTQRKLDSCENEKNQLNKKSQADHDEIRTLKINLEAAETRRDSQQKEIELLSQQIQSKEKFHEETLATLRADSHIKATRIERLERELPSMQKLIESQQTELQRLESQLQKNHSASAVHIDKVTVANATLAKMKEDHVKKINELNASVQAREDQIRQLQSKAIESEQDVEKRKADIAQDYCKEYKVIEAIARGLVDIRDIYEQAASRKIKIHSELDSVVRSFKILGDINQDGKNIVSLYSRWLLYRIQTYCSFESVINLSTYSQYSPTKYTLDTRESNANPAIIGLRNRIKSIGSSYLSWRTPAQPKKVHKL